MGFFLTYKASKIPMALIPISLPPGASTDALLTFSLADYQSEFPADTVYFSSPSVVCIQASPFVDATCSTAAEANPWVTMPGAPFVHHSLVVPDPSVPSIPEPAYGVLVFVLLFLIVAILHRSPS